jgi:hypothetical protein
MNYELTPLGGARWEEAVLQVWSLLLVGLGTDRFLVGAVGQRPAHARGFVDGPEPGGSLLARKRMLPSVE